MKRHFRLKLNLILMSMAMILITAVFVYTDPSNHLAKAEKFLPVREIEIIGNEPEPKIVEIKPFNHILEKIEKGKKILGASKPLQMIEYGNKKREISMAILDTATGDVFEQRYWIEQRDLDRANELRTNTCGNEDHFPYLKPITENPEFFVVVNWWNSHNSNLSIVKDNCEEPDRYIVVANKSLVPNSYLAYPEDKTGKKYSDIIYTPYSENIHREELIAEGIKFLNEKVASAFEYLKEHKIQSRAFPNQLVVDTISPEFVKNIFINEQSDPETMLTSADKGRRTAERALIRLGTNKDTAFRYTYSSVGALGLAQIMPETYKNIARDYPEVALIKDVDIGRADVLNSIKASILVHDDHYGAVVRRANQSESGKRLLSQKNQNEVEDIKAAIYNGGPGKYNSQTGVISLAIPETVSFLLKFSLIRQLRLFD